jgi:hypothetical protein
MLRALAMGIMGLIPVLASGASFASATQGSQGLQDGWAIDDDGKFRGGLHLLADGEFTFMKNAGAGWTRINFRLGNCFRDWTTPVTQVAIDTGQCHPSTLNRTALDQYVEVVRVARAQGLRVLGLLSNESLPGDQSDWTFNNAEHTALGDGDNTYIRRFATVAGVLAARFSRRGQGVDEWEVWNEPNAWSENPRPGVYTGSSFIYPSNFAQLLRRSYAAIKRAAPGAVVISGGLFGHDPAGAAVISVEPNGVSRRIIKRGTYVTSSESPAAPELPLQPGARATCASAVPSRADYLCQTYRMGFAHAHWDRSAPFDHVGQHLYIDQGGATSSVNIAQFLNDVRQTYQAFEGRASSKQTEITEFGWNTLNPGVTEAIQASNLTTAYTTFRSTPYVRRAFWFRTQDLPWDGYGLIGFEWEGAAIPKPAFTAYQQTAVF